MRKIPVILLLAFFAMPAIYGQIKIGDNPQTISPTSVLELESNDRVLVITRINTVQMNAIMPNQGAMVYNTDTQCIHYFNGGEWINLCNSAGFEFTTDPIENDVETIVITDQAGTKNFEVAPNSIGSLQIINGGINGVDIQDGSIGQGKLQNQSVTQDKLSENSVGAFALDNANIDLGDFSNGPGFITGADIVSGDGGNNIVVGGDNGAFYDNQPVLDAIGINTTAIQNHITADADTNVNNEIQTLSLSGNDLSLSLGNTITLPSTTGEIDDNEIITNMVLNGSNELVITEGANTPVQVDLSPLAGGTADGSETIINDSPTVTVAGTGTTLDPYILTSAGGADGSETIINDSPTVTVAGTGTTLDPYLLTSTGGADGSETIINDSPTVTVAGTGTTLDPYILTSSAGGNQNLAQVLAEGTDGGAALIKNILNPVDPQDAATKAYVDAAVTGGGTLADGTILIGDASNNPVSQNVGGDATLANDGTLTIAANAIGTGEIDNDAILLEDLNQNLAGDGQIIKWNNTAGVWEIADDDTGTATLNDGNIFVGDASNAPVGVVMSGDATIDNTGALTVADDAIELGMLAPPDPAGTPTPANGQVMVWDNDNTQWIIDDQAAESTGSPNALFFADKDPANLGKPTTADDNSFTNDDGGLLWDPEGRRVSGIGFGALYVGLDGFVPSTVSKVHISDNFPGFAYALHLQNHNADVVGRTTGILFSANPGDYGKGALIYERQLSEGRGDFHFLQDDAADTNRADISDVAFTIKNNKDIRLYGGIDVDGTPTGLGTAGQVLSSTGTGVQWMNGGAGESNTASNIGTAGIGVWAAKNLVDLQFKNINGLDANIITVNDDAVNNEIDLDIRDESIDPTTKIQPLTPTPAANQMLITDTSGDVIWEPVPTGTGNLATTNLTQTATENRTYNLNGQELAFIGAGGQIGIGDFGGTGPASIRSKLDVDGQITASNGFAATTGSVGQPSYGFFTNGDTDTGMFRAAENEIGFSVGGILGLTIDLPGSGIPNVIINQSIQLDGTLLDGAGNPGATGEVLTSTVTGTEWQAPASPFHSMAKMNEHNVPTNAQNIQTVNDLNTGNYEIVFDTAASSTDYVIQLTLLNAGAGSTIEVTNQTVGGFTVQISDTLGATDADWYFTVVDL